MINFYTNRELSQKLDLNLSKWKRWSREFLPPDPLGGMQSGYARQYNPKEAFTVYLGGCLVAGLKFSIPEAKQILYDLNDWIEQDLLQFNKKNNNTESHGPDAPVRRHTIFISLISDSQNRNQGLFYRVRETVSDEPLELQGRRIRRELYTETCKSDVGEVYGTVDTKFSRVLSITSIYDDFVERLNQTPRKE